MALVFYLGLWALAISVSAAAYECAEPGIFIGGLIFMYGLGEYIETWKRQHCQDDQIFQDDYSGDDAPADMTSGWPLWISGKSTICPGEDNSVSGVSWDFEGFDIGGCDCF